MNTKNNSSQNGNYEWRERQTARLFRSAGALKWLRGTLGLIDTVIAYFELGLTPQSNDREYADALVYPIRNKDGTSSKHCMFLNVPGVTTWSPGTKVKREWGAKPPRLYWSGAASERSTLLVLPRPTDVWRVESMLRVGGEVSNEVVAVASSHGVEHLSDILEIKDHAFWKGWNSVIFDQQISPDMVAALLPYINREMKIARVPQAVSNTGDRCGSTDSANDAMVDSLRACLKAAVPFVPDRSNFGCLGGEQEEVDPRSLFHNGHLYYAFERLVRGVKDGVGAEEYQTFVVKSDRTIHTIVKSPKLTPQGREVYRLTDGTLVKHYVKALRPSERSWEERSILEFVASRETPCPLSEIVNRIIMHLKAAVWIPAAHDYVALALGIVTSYAQEIFPAVPLFLVVGPPGSGKTVLAEESARLGCNGRALGRTTLAGLMEAIDRSRGLVAIDDLEELAPGKKGAASTNPLQQLIKQSYKKFSGTQTRVGDDGDLEVRNVYGVKIVNNTKGVDLITAHRVFTIRTVRRTEEIKRDMEQFCVGMLQPDEVRTLRNQIHQWVFSNIHLISSTYKRIIANGVAREDEVAAPLRTFATLTGDPSIMEQLESVTAAREQGTAFNLDEAINKISTDLISQGYTAVTAHHVVNECRLLFGQNCFEGEQGNRNVRTLVKTVAGHLLRSGWVGTKPDRPRINHSVNKRIRAYPFREAKLQEVLETLAREGKAPAVQPKAATSFCVNCAGCKYDAHCSLRETQT